MQGKIPLHQKKARQRIVLSVYITFLTLFFTGASGSSYYRGNIAPYHKRVSQNLAETTHPVKELRDAPISFNNIKREVPMKKTDQSPHTEEGLYESPTNLFLNTKGTMIDYWPLPYEIEERGKASREDIAVWLYSRLLKKGFTNIRLIIGKYRSTDITFHAWVVWHHGSRIFVLDPTHQSAIRDLRDFPADYYRPYCSYYNTDKESHHNIKTI